jgi:hypothetical protein
MPVPVITMPTPRRAMASATVPPDSEPVRASGADAFVVEVAAGAVLDVLDEDDEVLELEDVVAAIVDVVVDGAVVGVVEVDEDDDVLELEVEELLDVLELLELLDDEVLDDDVVVTSVAVFWPQWA